MANDVTSKVILGLDPSEFRRGIQQVDAKLKETSRLFSNLGQVIGASFAVAAIQNFASESIRLAREAEGVRNAFLQLNNPQVLDNLRAAVKGTVSDLELMKSANQAKSIGIDMQDLGKVMQYVSKYARATGQDMNQLMSDATLELVRQTGLRLDQLGISLVEVRKRMKETGDFTSAVLAEMAEKSAALGDQGETAAEKLDRLTATIENQKTELGGKLLPIYSWFLEQLQQILELGPRVGDALAEITGAVMRVPVALLGGLDQAAGQGMQGEKDFLMGRQNALAAALAAGQGPKKVVETLALLRGQLQDYVAQLEQAEIGSKAFSIAKQKVEELTTRIKELTTPLKEVFVVPTAEAIKLADKGLAYINNELTYQDRILRSGLIPAYDEMALMIKGAKRQLEDHAQTMEAAALVGAQFGHILTSAFTASMNTGEDFFQSMRRAIIEYTKQIAVALAVTTALAAIFSAVTGKSFVTAFKGVAKGTGLGAFFGEGGLFEMNATVKGADLKLGTDRSTVNLGRSGG